MPIIEKIFPAAESALDDVLAFVEEELEKADCPMKIAMQITVSVEEMFINIASYAYPDGEGEMKLLFSSDGGVAEITLVDSGIPFDPLTREDPDVTLSAEERQIGGLGIFMVKKTMDSVSYERTDGCNRFRMTKKIG